MVGGGGGGGVIITTIEGTACATSSRMFFVS